MNWMQINCLLFAILLEASNLPADRLVTPKPDKPVGGTRGNRSTALLSKEKESSKGVSRPIFKNGQNPSLLLYTNSCIKLQPAF